jgi:hypothetical protein
MKNFLKREYIISRCDSYESIHTEYAYCKFFLRIKYCRYYTSFHTIIPSKLSRKLYSWFRLSFLIKLTFNNNIDFERVNPSKDQVTYWQPWMNIN